MPKLQGLIYNLDCTEFFYTHALKDGVDGGALLDAYIDLIAEAGVKTFLCNTNARETNYRSGVWQSFWEGYDPAGPDDQPFLKAMPEEGKALYRQLVHSMWALDHQGVDYPARIIERCRLRGMSPWISLRMNDVHFNDNIEHPFHPEFWRDPKRWRNTGGYFARGLDWAQPDVREKYRQLVVETLERYDIEGLELDFMREPYLFREGAEQEGAALLHEWLRGVRKLVEETAARRGHPIAVAVRVPSRVEVAQAWGLDAVQWAREGLVDVVVVTPRWATLEYDMPIAQWHKLLASTAATLAGGLEIRCQPVSSGPAHTVTPEEAAGAAATVLAGGADAVYLFNYFPAIIGTSGWTRERYVSTLAAMNSLEALQKLPRRQVVTWRDILGPHETYQPPLPAQGTALSFELPALAGEQGRLELTLTQADKAPAVAVNGADAGLAGHIGDVWDYEVGKLRERNEITVRSEVAVKVTGVALSVGEKR